MKRSAGAGRHIIVSTSFPAAPILSDSVILPTPTANRRLILASSSPYRRELLARLRIPFESMTPDVDETARDGELPGATAVRLSQSKARACAARVNGESAWIIGCDQVACVDGKHLGKPGSHARALEQLRMMRGRTVEFHSGLCLLDTETGRVRSADVLTRVSFRHLTDLQLDAYLTAERPYDVAGSAKVESLGIALAERIESDDPTALIGLPLIALTNMLMVAGFPLFEKP